MELLVLYKARWEGLGMLLLGYWLPMLATQSTSSSPRSPPPPSHAPWELCKPLLLPVLATCSCDAALSRGLRGWDWLATFALHFTAPLWLNLHCKRVRPPPKGTCCRPLEEVCMGGTALDMGCMPSVPRFIYGSSLLKMSANWYL